MSFFIALIVSIMFSFTSFVLNYNSDSFIVFCDVGQGDASYIHIKPNIDIVIDAGKGSSVLNCLGKYMHPYDNTIEVAFITHFQSDHYGGFLELHKRYLIKHLYVSSLKPMSREAAKLLSVLENKKVKIELLYEGDVITINNAVFRLLWPTEEYVQATTEQDNLNDGSQVMLFSFKDNTVLYTGDATPHILKRLLRQTVSKVGILKVPHHGSKNGLIYEFLSLADPTYSVISVGKRNSYGHPSPEILTMLNEIGTEILRTDKLGDVLFRFD